MGVSKTKGYLVGVLTIRQCYCLGGSILGVPYFRNPLTLNPKPQALNTPYSVVSEVNGCGSGSLRTPGSSSNHSYGGVTEDRGSCNKDYAMLGYIQGTPPQLLEVPICLALSEEGLCRHRKTNARSTT